MVSQGNNFPIKSFMIHQDVSLIEKWGIMSLLTWDMHPQRTTGWTVSGWECSEEGDSRTFLKCLYYFGLRLELTKNIDNAKLYIFPWKNEKHRKMTDHKRMITKAWQYNMFHNCIVSLPHWECVWTEAKTDLPQFFNSTTVFTWSCIFQPIKQHLIIDHRLTRSAKGPLKASSLMHFGYQQINSGNVEL